MLSSQRREQLDLEACKARLEEIGSRLKLGKLNEAEAEADAARLALLSEGRSSRSQAGKVQRGTGGTLIGPVAVFLFIAGVGAVATYMEDPPAGSAQTISLSQSHSEPDDDVVTRLKAYSRSIGAEAAPSVAAAGGMPDIDTMIDRLAARLSTSPQDIEGWQMLGRSYFHTARYEKAAAAFARAIELDPSSAELKRSLDEAKAKASESAALETVAPVQ